jgi:hypothetical protein
MGRRKSREETVASMCASERIAMAEKKSEQLAELLVEIERAHANNQYLTYSPQVLGDQIGAYMASNAFASVRVAAFGYELVRLSALWDAPAVDRISIPEISLLISSREVKEELRQRINDHYPHSDMAWLRSEAVSRFERSYKTATSTVRKVTKAHRLTSLRNWRDKWFAHNLEIDVIGPKYGYERKMRRVSHKLANALTGVLRQSSFDYDHTVQLCKKHADQLWRNIYWTPPEIPRS